MGKNEQIKPLVNKENIKAELKKLGNKSSDTVAVHSSLSEREKTLAEKYKIYGKRLIEAIGVSSILGRRFMEALGSFGLIHFKSARVYKSYTILL